MTTHTPGPWAVDMQTYEVTATRTWRGQPATLIVADVGQEAPAAIPDDECLANARLIAQAPAMLAALRTFFDAYKAHNQALARIEARSTTVDVWMKSNLRLRAGRSSGSRYNPSARDAGRRAGQSINLSGPRTRLTSGAPRLGA
jgi:hypothetical protein